MCQDVSEIMLEFKVEQRPVFTVNIDPNMLNGL